MAATDDMQTWIFKWLVTCSFDMHAILGAPYIKGPNPASTNLHRSIDSTNLYAIIFIAGMGSGRDGWRVEYTTSIVS